MTSDVRTDLTVLQQEIDQIDTQIHDLLMDRSRIAAEIAASERNLALPIRPAREAALLRRLIDRHRGHLPLITVFRIWREMVVGCAVQRQPITVAVSIEDANDPLWDLARDHFGGAVTYRATGLPNQTVRALADGSAGIGVVPWPESAPSEPWWLPLLTRDDDPLRVVAALPALASSDPTEAGALMVARHRHSKTGDDRTLLAIELAADVSRGRLRELLEGVGLQPVNFWSWDAEGNLSHTMQLFEIDDYVANDDERLQQLSLSLGSDLIRAQSIGGFAVQMRREG